ncbi:hypothetical protein NEOLEDRAFT_752890 [Neolentinus lepideus HHB14362 ss-1]|uniref:Uncharacterized protein n=1 Tax=Neolentinus lepideus HHB14362 ss-1 TaxID=1314782 RepID=A0A165PUM9_9AGAM|nr:hypothetical protein NEOLEDRAFT_752890 [Neolentinus lepideus HHB14362 ss-1]
MPAFETRRSPARREALYREAIKRYNILGEVIEPYERPMEHSSKLTSNLLRLYDIVPVPAGCSVFQPPTRPDFGVDANHFEDFAPCHADTDMTPAEAVDSPMEAETTITEDPYLWDAPPSGMNYGTWWSNSVDEAHDGDDMGVDGEYFGSRH